MSPRRKFNRLARYRTSAILWTVIFVVRFLPHTLPRVWFTVASWIALAVLWSALLEESWIVYRRKRALLRMLAEAERERKAHPAP